MGYTCVSVHDPLSVCCGCLGQKWPGVTGCQRHFRLGLCCTCTASCEAHLLLSPAIPSIEELAVKCKSSHGLQQFKDASISLHLFAFWTRPQGFRWQWTPLIPAPAWAFPLAMVPPDTCWVCFIHGHRCLEVFWHALVCDHRCCKVCLLLYGLILRSQSLWLEFPLALQLLPFSTVHRNGSEVLFASLSCSQA